VDPPELRRDSPGSVVGQASGRYDSVLDPIEVDGRMDLDVSILVNRGADLRVPAAGA